MVGKGDLAVQELTKLDDVYAEVAVLRPLYQDGAGDGTEVILRSGERFWQGRQIKSVRTALARLYGVDLVALRSKYGRLLGRSSSVPLPLSPRLTLVPLRLRQPRCRGDACLGYVSFREVKEVREYASGCFRSLIVLASGVQVEVLSRRRIVLEHLSAARLVEDYYLRQNGWIGGREGATLEDRIGILFRALTERYLA